MILHTFDIPIDHFGDNEPILLMPVGDIQWFGEYDATAIKMLARHIQWGVDHGAYFLGMGDYLDTFSPSNRERLAAAGVYDSGKKWMDKSAKKLVEELYEVALAQLELCCHLPKLLAHATELELVVHALLNDVQEPTSLSHCIPPLSLL